VDGEVARALARLAQRLHELAAGRTDAALRGVDPENADVPGLARAASVFQLSPFERDVLLIGAAAEVDARFSSLLGRLGGSAAPYPTVGAACTVLAPEAPHAIARFLPGATLRALGLIELDPGAPLALATFRCATDVWPSATSIRRSSGGCTSRSSSPCRRRSSAGSCGSACSRPASSPTSTCWRACR
jgi:hypothetical protein